MRAGSILLNEQDRAKLQVLFAFLDGRLEERATINWALRLKGNQHVERWAIKDLLSSPRQQLKEPWAKVWHLIEESWVFSGLDSPYKDTHDIKRRLLSGERSGTIIQDIVDLVKPYVKVESRGTFSATNKGQSKKPKVVDDLIYASLTSGPLLDLDGMRLEGIDDINFLRALGLALDAALISGLETARRIGWDGENNYWKLGELGSVRYRSKLDTEGIRNEPDEYHHGIAPVVKLLYAVVESIAERAPLTALPFVLGWAREESNLHTRLWAAAAERFQLIPIHQVEDFLLSIDDSKFWGVYAFPEIAELRAARLNELRDPAKKQILKRLKKSPPRKQWPKDAEAERVQEAKKYWSARELQRIVLYGGILPVDYQNWLSENIVQFDDLINMEADAGFPASYRAQWVRPSPDSKYDTLIGVARLHALESAFSSSRGGWDNDPAERANDWLRSPKNALLVISDLESAENGGDEFPLTWSRFGWAHTPIEQSSTEQSGRDLLAEAQQVLVLLNQLSEKTLSTAIESISAWLHSWEDQVITFDLGYQIWFRIWPFAVDATNAASDNENDVSLNLVVKSADDENDPMDLDTLNTPAGRLVGVFLRACPALSDVPAPFGNGTTLADIRSAAINAPGRSGLIVRHRMIEALPYFLHSDRPWAEEHLIRPLLQDDGAAIALWRAIARRTHFHSTLEIIGSEMIERATDRRLGRGTRQKLVFSLVVECLHALNDARASAVPFPRIQQMLRTVEDEIRASAANTVRVFVRDMARSAKKKSGWHSAAHFFKSAAVPFLQRVWPQELSLITPGVSDEFANLPAVAEEAFAEAVNVVARFLVPFKCWSLADYGFHGEVDGYQKLSLIDDEAKAKALLHLLDLTIDGAEGAVIPYDLTDALEQVKLVAPNLTGSKEYRRLSTMARR